MENRETFFARVQPFFPPSTIRGIELAYYLAKHGHRSQVRKEKDAEGNPLRYFEHVRGVTLILMDEAKCMHPEMIIASLLHDSIEDTRDLTPELIEHAFGTDVCCIVKTLSKTPKEGYIERLNMCQDWRTLTVKACDRLHNLRSLLADGVAPEFVLKQTKETMSKYYPIFDKLLELTPRSHLKDISYIRDEVRKTTERCAAIIHEVLKEKVI